MKETIPAWQIQLGMFVVELDRPWLGTPFLLQGFLVEDEEQIADLKAYCTDVVIDRSRSIGDHYRNAPRVDVAIRRDAAPSRASSVRVTGAESATKSDEFISICRTLREKPPQRRAGAPVPEVFGTDKQSRLEAELLYSAPIVDDVKQKLQTIRDSLDKNIAGDIKEVVGLVAEMAESVERNPDAMIWLTRLRSTDEYTYDHAVDVSVHLMVLARFLGMPAKTVELLGQVGLMQDIGKIRLPASLLNKTEALNEEEVMLVRSHVASSMQLLVGQSDFPVEALNIVGSHHERHDGSGYPRRISGEKISLNAELAGLIDCYCAMTRQRIYKSAVSSQQALENLIALRDKQFRAPLVDQLIQCVGLYPIGSLVELNSGEVGVVIQQNQVRRLRPRVMIVLAPDKSVDRRPRTLDLIMEPLTGSGEPYRILHSLPMNAYGINPSDYYLE